MAAADSPQEKPDADGPRRGSAPLTLSKKIFSLVFVLVLAALLVLAVRRAPADALAGLAHANPGLLVASLAVFLASHAFRAARLNLLLPPGSRVPPLRAYGLSGASHVLVQVVPFRGGDVASLALLRRELGETWSRSSGVFVLVKLVDTAAAFLVGLAGGAVVLVVRRAEGGPWVAALLVALALALAVLPSGGGVVLDAVSARAGRWPRLERVLREAAKGLAVARSNPSAYAAACVLSVAFLGAHLLGLKLAMAGLGLDVSFATLAFATLAATLVAAVVPSPAGTFGTAESGWIAALALDGVPLAAGAVSGVVVHLLATAAAGVAGLLVLARPRR